MEKLQDVFTGDYFMNGETVNHNAMTVSIC